MNSKIDCKYAKSYNGKHLKCKRNGSYRNIQKKNCTFYCPYYKKKILKTSDYEKVTLNYQYKDTEYKNSNAVNLCFENRNLNI